MDFSTVTITDVRRITALNDLLTACAQRQIAIDEVIAYLHGFCVTFKKFPDADAALHDETCGHLSYKWETMGFPWDGIDVSMHTTAELVDLLVQEK